MRRTDPAKTEERRRQVLAAALACFRRSGFRGASMSEICAEAGMSAGHLYHYFDGKEAIIEAIVDEDRRAAAALIDRLASHPDIPVALCEAAGLALEPNGFALDDVLASEIFAEAARNPRVAAILRRFDAHLRGDIRALLAEGQRRGQIDPELDTAAATTLLQAIVDGLSCRIVADPGFDRDATLAALRLLFARFLVGHNKDNP